MSCCDETTARVPTTDVSRRSLFKGAALIASVIPAARPEPSEAQGKRIKLAYSASCSAACPTRSRARAAISRTTASTELVYLAAAVRTMQALVGGAVDYAATALDVAIQA
jgi:NitT/TauT family transport system substrate-binding protein